MEVSRGECPSLGAIGTSGEVLGWGGSAALPQLDRLDRRLLSELALLDRCHPTGRPAGSVQFASVASREEHGDAAAVARTNLVVRPRLLPALLRLAHKPEPQAAPAASVQRARAVRAHRRGAVAVDPPRAPRDDDVRTLPDGAHGDVLTANEEEPGGEACMKPASTRSRSMES